MERSFALVFLALVAGLFALHWAREILVPILFGVMLSYSLTPIVNLLERWKLPRVVGAAALLLAMVGAMGWGVWSLSDDVEALADTLPQISQKVREFAQSKRSAVRTIEKVQQAATELAAPDTAPRAVKAATRASEIDIRGYVLSGTIGALTFLGQVAVVFTLALFLLASGSSFRRKMVTLAGPTLSQKRVTVETLDEISRQIQRYLLVQLGVSVMLGVATWLAFWAVGLNQAPAWGVVAGVTNLVPYVGAITLGVGSAAVALVQFGTLDMALLVGGISFALHAVIGNLVAPWWMGRASRMSAVAVFVAILVFGWLWGVAGLLLGVPILLVVKAVCDRVEELKAVGELLGA